jgi:ribosomal protection tetracycline resistance protein
MLKNRDVVVNATQNIEEKVSQIRKLQGQKYTDTGELVAGDTAAICGLSQVRAGDILGSAEGIHEQVSITTPLLTVRVLANQENEFPQLVAAMQLLADEDPTIDLLWLRDERELHIKIIGLIQLEILEAVLADRFDLNVTFGEPTVIYKETPLGSGEGYEEYTMPKPCWGVVMFKLEPDKLGSGVTYHSIVGVNKIAARYQNEIERTIPLALQQGTLGWEVTDIKITLIGGEHHNIHSRAGDFAIATPMAIMNGLKSIGTKLLEPILNFTISAPENTLGKIASSLTLLRAEFGNPELTEEKFTLKGIIPVATSLDYSAKLSSITGGKGKFKTSFSGYRECPLELGKTTEFRGISPLDRAKYILKARKAIQ